MPASVEQYVGERAEILTRLILTRRKDVRLIPLEAPQELGVDLLVQLTTAVSGGQILPTFGLQVLGTSEPLTSEEEATQYANRHGKKRQPKGLFLWPVVVFLFSMENDQGYYSWLMKPFPGKDGKLLERVATLEMTKLTRRSVDQLLEEIEKWFAVLSEMLLRLNQAK